MFVTGFGFRQIVLAKKDNIRGNLLFWKNSNNCCLKRIVVFLFCSILLLNHCSVSVAMQHMQDIIMPIQLLPHFCVVIFSCMTSPNGNVSYNNKKHFFLSTFR